MKRAHELQIGEIAIYIYNGRIMSAERVETPIDAVKQPSMFKIGRVDLSNGDYLLSVTTVYNSVEEAKLSLINEVREAIVKYEDQRKELDVLIKAAQAKLNDLIVDK